MRALAQLQSPIAGTLTTKVDLAAGRSEGIRLDLGLGAGRWQNGMLPFGILEFASGELHATYAPEQSQLRLEKFALDLGGGTRLVLDGSLDGITQDTLTGRTPPPNSVGARLSAVLSGVPVNRLDKLWPAAFSPGGRRDSRKCP